VEEGKEAVLIQADLIVLDRIAVNTYNPLYKFM
jgi:hypothetical protein